MLNTSINRGMSLAATFGCLCMLGYTAAGFALSPELEQSEATQQSSKPFGDASFIELSELPLHLFGTSPQVKTADEMSIDITKLARTHLNLTLIGVLEKGSDSIAVIQIGNGPQTPYRLGDTVQSGVKLISAETKWVVLENQGVRETLFLEDVEAITETEPSVAATPSSSSNGGETRVLSARKQERLIAYHRQLRENPLNLMDVVKIRPFYQGSDLLGFEIRPGTEPGLFTDLGFESKDIITQINNIQFDSFAMAAMQAPTLIDDETYQVHLLRKNQPLQLSVSIAQ